MGIPIYTHIGIFADAESVAIPFFLMADWISLENRKSKKVNSDTIPRKLGFSVMECNQSGLLMGKISDYMTALSARAEGFLTSLPATNANRPRTRPETNPNSGPVRAMTTLGETGTDMDCIAAAS